MSLDGRTVRLPTATGARQDGSAAATAAAPATAPATAAGAAAQAAVVDDAAWRFEDEPFSGRLDPVETLRIAWRSILANLTRSLLTTLGVIIGVAAVVALTAIGAGVTGNVTENLTSLGTNLLTVTSAATAGPGGGIVRVGGAQTVKLGDAEAIAALDDDRVAGIAPVLQTNGQVRASSLNTNATVIGTWADYAAIRNSQPDEGSFFTDVDVASRRSVVVLGYEVAQELFPYGGAVGSTVRINNQSYTVIGTIGDKGNSGFQSPNRQVFVPLSTYLQRIGRQSSVGEQAVQQIIVQGSDAKSLTALQEDLTQLIAERHEQYDPTSYDFTIQNQADTLASFNAISTTLTLFLGSIAGISLVVGGIGIMNIMLVSVTERTREIGIRKALGARPGDILSQFLLEAVVLSVGGGIIGMGAGVGAAYLAGPLVGITPTISAAPIAVAFLFSLAVGVFFGFYPARRAGSLDPVESLRYE